VGCRLRYGSDATASTEPRSLLTLASESADFLGAVVQVAKTRVLD